MNAPICMKHKTLFKNTYFEKYKIKLLINRAYCKYFKIPKMWLRPVSWISIKDNAHPIISMNQINPHSFKNGTAMLISYLIHAGTSIIMQYFAISRTEYFLFLAFFQFCFISFLLSEQLKLIIEFLKSRLSWLGFSVWTRSQHTFKHFSAQKLCIKFFFLIKQFIKGP